MNDYCNLKNRHRKEFNDFPIMFAFSNRQFDEGMKKLGLDPADTDKVFSVPGGGFIRKTDSEALTSLLDRHGEEMQKAVDDDSTGLGFVYEMFRYELCNHEYLYTRDVSDTLDALDLTEDYIISHPKLSFGLNRAIQDLKKEEEEGENNGI